MQLMRLSKGMARMGEEKLLTVRDVSLILGVSEKEVIGLVENGSLPAYRIGGVFLRFKKEQAQEFKKRFKPPANKSSAQYKYTFKNRFGDFLYFNDFYLLAAFIIISLLIIILKGY